MKILKSILLILLAALLLFSACQTQPVPQDPIESTEQSDLPQTEAEDHVVCQKILTRLQCTTKTVPVLEELGAFCRERGYGAACQALETMVDKCRQTGVAAYWD